MISGRSFTGPAASALIDVRALLAAGQEAWLGSRTGTALEQGCEDLGVPYVGGFRLGRGAARLLRLPRDVRRLRSVVSELKIDVVHLHRSDDQFMARLAGGRERSFRLVRTWHRDPARLARPILNKMVKSTDAICCVARSHAEALRAEGTEAVTYIPPGVDTDLFRPREQTGDDSRRRVLGLIGRWKSGEDRGQKAFLELTARLGRSCNWRGILLGRGENRPTLEAAIVEHPVSDRIELVTTSDAFPTQVADLDLGLVFETGSDGTSRAAVEMLACGVPLLVADRAGLRELAEDTTCARVLTGGDLNAWVREITKLLKEPSALDEMRKAARPQAETVHSLTARGKALAALYEQARK